MPPAFHSTPSAERYVLQADALRRRQLNGALLYGSGRSWRRRQRVWPAVPAGLVLIAIIIGAITVAGAFQRQRELNRERELRQNSGAAAVLEQAAPERKGQPGSGTPGGARPRGRG